MTTTTPEPDRAAVEAIARAIHDPCPWPDCTMPYGALDEQAAETAVRVLRSRGWRPPAPAPTVDHDGRPASAPRQWLAWLLDEVDTEVWTSIQAGDGDGDAVCVLADVRTRLARMLAGEIPVPPLAGSQPAAEPSAGDGD